MISKLRWDICAKSLVYTWLGLLDVACQKGYHDKLYSIVMQYCILTFFLSIFDSQSWDNYLLLFLSLSMKKYCRYFCNAFWKISQRIQLRYNNILTPIHKHFGNSIYIEMLKYMNGLFNESGFHIVYEMKPSRPDLFYENVHLRTYWRIVSP